MDETIETTAETAIDGVLSGISASAVEAVDGVLRLASESGASDIHLDPRPHGVLVRFRVDGEMEAIGVLPARIHEEMVARLKILSGARTDIHAVPQDGRFQATFGGEPCNVRVSFMPTYRGENAVIRLLSAAAVGQDSFSSLGFTPAHVEVIRRAISARSGLVLVTGPTGSGKTTTLRVCLGLKAVEPISVMTLEDPVEYEVPGVRHIHIRHSHGVTFASGLRSALRQDPDVVMVGEIRDDETARTAARTALTGHLVLSTMHTGSAIEAVLRLADMGVERYLIAATLRLVVGQRLVRRICGDCEGDGGDCVSCRGSGMSGRCVIAEVLEIDRDLGELIASGASSATLHSAALAKGFRTIREDADEKVDWGVISAEEVVRAISS